MLLHDIIPRFQPQRWGFFFCCTLEQCSDCRFTPPAVAASHWSLPVTGRRTDRRRDRVRRRCLLTHASLRHGISFQLDAPADFPGVIMKLFDVGRFLITEHSAGQIRFVMTAAPLWRAAGLVIGKTISSDCQYISLLLRAVGAAGVLRTLFNYFIVLNWSAVEVAVKALILPLKEISLIGMQETN